MRKLRAFYTAHDIAEVYKHPYSHAAWPEHEERVKRTIEVAQQLIDRHQLNTAADLSAGDDAVMDELHGLEWKHTNDVSRNGDGIETTIKILRPVDLFICTETIEHLEAPWTVLEQIAQRTKWLVLSTPLDESPLMGNYEHYWSFTFEDVRDLLIQAEFNVHSFELLANPQWTYSYQLWTAVSDAP